MTPMRQLYKQLKLDENAVKFTRKHLVYVHVVARSLILRLFLRATKGRFGTVI